MDEPNPKPLAKPTQPGPTPEPAAKTDGSIALELAFARGSSHGEAVPERIDRPEHSVMEGLPQAKAERIASVYREVAELQRQLSTAQQRIATELQGRADDAERHDAMEAHLQAQELKTQQAATRAAELETQIADLRSKLAIVTTTGEELRRDVVAREAQIEEARRQHKDTTEQLEVQSASLREAKGLLLEAKALLETRDAELATRTTELATRTTERDTEQATKSRLERELEDARKQHSDASATRDAELAAMTAERDTHKGELEKVRRELETGRAKARDLASQLVKVGQELDGAIAMPHVERAHRSQPPPLPTAKAATDARPVETILEVTEVPKQSSGIRSALLTLVGVIVGCGLTFAIVKANNESTTPTARDDVGGPPPAALTTQPAVETAPSPVVRGESAEPTAPAAQTPPAANTDENTARPAAPAATKTDGVLLLPEDAAGHRLFVDGKVVEFNGSRAVVPCGTHEVRIGSRGTPRTIDVACGGETAIPAETPDH